MFKMPNLMNQLTVGKIKGFAMAFDGSTAIETPDGYVIYRNGAFEDTMGMIFEMDFPAYSFPSAEVFNGDIIIQNGEKYIVTDIAKNEFININSKQYVKLVPVSSPFGKLYSKVMTPMGNMVGQSGMNPMMMMMMMGDGAMDKDAMMMMMMMGGQNPFASMMGANKSVTQASCGENCNCGDK